MSKLLFILLLVSTSAFADPWRTEDTYREAVFQTLNLIDWGQTRYVAKHPNQYQEVESAWLIGKHPSTTDVDRLMLATAVLHPVISYYLPREWRTAFQYVTVGMKLNNTIGNFSAGIKFEF